MKRECFDSEEETESSTVSEDEETEDQENSSQPTAPAPARLGSCEVCNAQVARYTCPKCEVKTCTVRCVQIHKKELDCNGIRDRTKYIPLRKMTKADFMSDYYFLEEATRYVATRKTDQIKRFTRYNKLLPKHLFSLRRAAAERKTTLRFLLMNFTRHKENTTRYDWNQKRIYWRVEWVFPNACNAKYIDDHCDEEQPLYKLLEKYVGAKEAMKGLEFYQSVGNICRLKVLLKAEGIKRCSRRFYELDCRQTLRENLANKTVVEFPCIHVSYEDKPAGLDVIDSDDDIMEETKRYEKELETLSKEQWQKHKLKQMGRGEVKSKADMGDDEDTKKLQEIMHAKKVEERRRKREELERAPSNYLFTDEQLWDLLSSSSSENDNETEEETEPT